MLAAHIPLCSPVHTVYGYTSDFAYQTTFSYLSHNHLIHAHELSDLVLCPPDIHTRHLFCDFNKTILFQWNCEKTVYPIGSLNNHSMSSTYKLSGCLTKDWQALIQNVKQLNNWYYDAVCESIYYRFVYVEYMDDRYVSRLTHVLYRQALPLPYRSL